MKNNFMKAAVLAAVFGLMAAGNAAASISVQNSSVETPTQDNDYQKLVKKLEAFKAKVQKSSKADLPALVDEAKAIKADIVQANVTEDELAALKKTFNDIIELCKTIN